MFNRNQSRREFLRNSSMLIGMGLLAGCAPAAVSPTPTGGGQSAPSEALVELRVHTRTGNDLSMYFEEVLAQFKEIMPNVETKLEVVPGDALEYAAKVLVLSAGDQMGDVVWSASRAGFNRRFMAVGILEPLDPFIEGEGFDLDRYYPNCIAETRYEGKVMALPHISEPGQVGLMLNLDLFEQAGVEPVNWDTTMDDLIQAAVKIVETANDGSGTKVFGFARGVNYFNWVTHVRSFGGDFLNPEGTQCVLDDDRALAAFQHLYDLAYEYEIAPSPAQIAENEGMMFQGGSLAMTSGWPIQSSQWPMSITDFTASSTMIPPGPDRRGSMLNQHMMSVATASRHKDAAWEWVKWSCSAEFSKARAMAGRGGPVGMAEVWNDEELLETFPSWREWAMVMDDVGPNYTAANLRGKEVEDTFNQGIAAIMVQEVGVEEGLERVRKACQEVLDKSIAL
jgi:multiple sugar transport system substrate-binding protein